MLTIRSDPYVPADWWSSAPHAGPALQAELVLPETVRAGRKKARGLPPRDNGRTGSSSATTGGGKVQREKKLIVKGFFLLILTHHAALELAAACVCFPLDFAMQPRQLCQAFWVVLQ